jgi:hypothetical protein
LLQNAISHYINNNSTLLKEQTRVKQMLDIEKGSKEPFIPQEKEEVDPCNRAACREQILISDKRLCLVLTFFVIYWLIVVSMVRFTSILQEDRMLRFHKIDSP